MLAVCMMVSPLQSQTQERWVKHYEAQGSTEYNLSPRPPYGNWPVVYNWSNYGWPLPFTPILSYSSNMDFSARANGTVTAVWQWLDANGNPAPNPPSRVYLKVTAGAGWGLGWGRRLRYLPILPTTVGERLTDGSSIRGNRRREPLGECI